MPTTESSARNHRNHKVLENLTWPLGGDEAGKRLLDLAIWRSQVTLRIVALVER